DVGRFPVVDRDACHRRVDCVVVERERLCVSADRWGSVGRALRTHCCARLDGENPTIGRLVGARAGANVEHRPRIAKRGMNPLGNTRIGAPVACVGASVLLVVDPVTSQSALSLSAHLPWGTTGDQMSTLKPTSTSLAGIPPLTAQFSLGGSCSTLSTSFEGLPGLASLWTMAPYPRRFVSSERPGNIVTSTSV